jgi:hypothetical protein
MSEENNNKLIPFIHDEEFRDYIINEGLRSGYEYTGIPHIL